MALIVGGGIGGGALALALAKKGRQVLVLEREKTPPHAGRPELLGGPTLDILQSLGVGEKILAEAARPINELELSGPDGRVLLQIGPDEFREAGARVYSTDPFRVREILLEQASRTGSAQVKRGVEVLGLLRKDGRVAGVHCKESGEEKNFSSELVIGDDGSHSRIRSELGIPIKLSEFPLKFLMPKRFLPAADPSGRGLARLDLWALRKGIVGGIFMPLPKEQSAFVFVMGAAAHARLIKEPAQFEKEAAALTPPAFTTALKGFRFPEDFILLDRPFGHAARYTAPGAVLLGDAAHPVTPAGGQGANMSIHDAASLAAHWEEPEEYEKRRRPANERSLFFSRRATTLFHSVSLFPPLASLGPKWLSRLSRENKIRLARSVSTAFLSPV